MTLLETHEFLSQLEKYFHRSRMGGPPAVTLTVKPYDGKTKPETKPSSTRKLSKKQKKAVTKRSSEPEEKKNLCLCRAKIGDKHISTVLHAKEVNRFHVQYMGLLKEHMNTLQKPSKDKKTTRRVTKAT